MKVPLPGAPCVCQISPSGQVTRPCLHHYGQLSERDRNRVRADNGITVIGDRR